MWHKQLDKHWRATKSFINQGYNRLSGFAAEMDKRVNVGRNIYRALAPILQEFGQTKALDQGMKAIQGYDAFRGNVVEADSTARRLARGVDAAPIFT